MADNETDIYDTELVRNVTEYLPEVEAEGMPVSEIITVAITSVLGLTGIVFNIAILVITFQKKLIKKDYRMLYYMFITFGDLLFAINCLFVGINIAFKSVYVFRVFGVCLTLMLLMGVVAYEWSAICIILLIVDLVWTIKNPFSENKKMKIFSKVGCISTFFIGIIIALGPFPYEENSFDLPFCSIGNLYGKRLDVFQHGTVILLCTLVAIMIFVSGVLLHQVYQSHALGDERNEPKTAVSVEATNGKCYQDVTGKQMRENSQRETTKGKFCVISIVNDPQSAEKEQDSPTVDTGIDKDESEKRGEVNNAFVGDNGDIVEDLRKSKAKRQDVEKERKIETDTFANYTRREVRRREFYRACRTVGIFMAAYLGCCAPYLIWNALGLACGSTCYDNNRPETRVIRALVATALYLLPVIDPILYTRRFDVFKKASVGVMRKLCPCNQVDRH